MASLTLSWLDNGIALLALDLVNNKQNLLRPELIEELSELLLELRQQTQLRALIIYSLKPDSFVAGADLNILQKLDTVEEGRLLTERGKEVLCQLQTLAVPVIAAIQGSCLGGGLELALACSIRIAAHTESTRFGLPEVQLGLLPGLAGTQALPKLIGLVPALDLLLTGRQLSAQQALKLGLIDELVPAAHLLAAAQQAVGRVYKKPRLWWDGFARYRQFVLNRARDQLEQKTAGHYPAPIAILDVVERGYHEAFEALAAESEQFGRLLVSSVSRNLVALFQASTEARKLPSTELAQPVEQVVIVGAGLMGTGIAWVSLDKTRSLVRLSDPQVSARAKAYGFCCKLLQRRVKQQRLSSVAAATCLSRLSLSSDLSGLAQANLVIEAVFEDLELKRQLLQQIEQFTPVDAILASNTSALSITQLAQGLQRPQQLIGMHYFSPVEKMPLLELVVTEYTNETTRQTALAYARAQGKTPILVKDSPGFYTTRILAAYLHEVAESLLAGAPVDWLDEALVNLGFPIGPCALLDEIGLDVAAKILPQMAQAFGADFDTALALDKLVQSGCYGRKSQSGFYRYHQGKKVLDKKNARLLGLKPQYQSERMPVFARRCLLRMVNEALRCWDEGILLERRDVDLGAVLGLGFPPFLGGPVRFVQQDKRALADLLELQSQYGARFNPADSFKQWAQTNHDWS